MTHTLRNWFQSHEKLTLALLVLVFVAIRFPGTSLPLHQDEYKWPMIVNPTYVSDVEIPHPPLGELIYRTAGEFVGFNVHFRFVPLFFGVLNLLLFYYALKLQFGKKTATIGAVLFTLSYFSVLASLMVDTDGAVIPFFFLCALVAYYKYNQAPQKNSKIWWFIALFISCMLGFLVKVSFVLVIGVLVADFLWEKRKLLKKDDLIRYGGIGFAGIIGLVLLLFITSKIFSFFNLSASLTYWKHFASGSRNWFQTCIQVAKVILYASPFFILIPFYLSKDQLKKLVPYVAYLIFGFIFYIILFDFSLGALDRYLQFIIIPLCVFCAVVIADLIPEEFGAKARMAVFVGMLVSVGLFFLQYIPQFVPALQPKSAWIGRILSLHWNFVYPFSGGSGPLGFYISFLFMGLAWIIAFILFAIGFFKKDLRKTMLLMLIPIGLIYNGMFAEEYLFGFVNGSAPKLVSDVTEFIKNDPDIKMVTVYNDNGGAEIQAIGKYRKRLYTDPKFDINEKVKTLNMYKEFYLEVDIPKIDPTSVYRKYLDSCTTVYDKQDHYISAIVHDCRAVPDIILK